VFNLEECMNNEFLRPRDNRCKWFNTFGVVRRSVYIVKRKKAQFSHKINILNRFTKYMNRFRQLKTRLKRKKDETIHYTLNQFKWTQDDDWYDSNLLWIDSSVSQRVLWDDSNRKEMIHSWTDSGGSESIQLKSETSLNQFRLYWVDSNDNHWILTHFQQTHNNKTNTHRFQGALTC